MSEPQDVTVQILRQIRDEIISTRTELRDEISSTRTELSSRIQELDEHLGSRIDAVEHAVLDLAEQQRFVVRYLRTVGGRGQRLEEEVDDLRTRLVVVEKKIG